MSRRLTFADRLVMEKAIAFGLEVKFGKEGLALMPQIEQLEENEAVQAILEAFKPGMSLDEVRKLIPTPANGQN